MAKKTPKVSKLKKSKPVIVKLLLAFFVVALAVFMYYCTENFDIKFDIKLKSLELVPVKQQTKVEVIKEVAVNEEVPKYWVYMSKNYMWIFVAVESVLNRMGLQKIEMNVIENQILHNDWSLLWSYDYHAVLPIVFKNIKYHQKINHIPGNYVLVTKDIFCTQTDSIYIPKAFNDTKSLLKYAESNPDKKFVQKLHSNRGVELKHVSEINLTENEMSKYYRYFAQEFVEDPLLIAGHKFDFGIYVVVTSVNPLRVYYYTKNTLIRLCKYPYDPENFENVDSYVISDVCLFSWDFPEIAKYYNQTYNYKDALELYLTNQGYDINRVWWQVEDCIRTILLSKEHHFIEALLHYGSKFSFFELFRFDFILDSKLNLHLLEINQSPNVNPSRLLYRDKRLFENLLYNVFNVVGIGSYIRRKSFEFQDIDTESMVCHPESITVMPEICGNEPCSNSCELEKCQMCWQCMNLDEKYELQMAYREHRSRGAMRRVIPAPLDSLPDLGVDYINTLTPINKQHLQWFIEMCKKDKSFC